MTAWLAPLAVLAAAAALSAAATWALVPLARRLGAVARVRPDRWHTGGEVPRLAGPAMLAAMAPWLPMPTWPALAFVCLIGTIDDIRPLSAGTKAAALAAAGLAAAWITGQWWVLPGLWLVANALNLLDHADGLAAATAAAGFLGLGGDAGLAAAGACLGFLLLNHPPARVFMGDSGSLTLGAALVLVGAAEHGNAATTAAWCAVPLADAVAVTLKRLWRKQKPWVGGTDHSGHALLRRGVPARLLPLLYFSGALAIGWLLAPA